MTDLVKYGIYEEESDVRVHVCPYVKRVYTFPTSKAIETLEDGDYTPIDGYQDGVSGRTSIGYNVPPGDIEECISIKLRDCTWSYLNIKRCSPTEVKGHKAAKLVSEMIRRGMLPLPANLKKSPYLDVAGTDILAHFSESSVRVQVKCDYKGGAQDLGGFGLFLQTHESNPGGRHDGEQDIDF